VNYEQECREKGKTEMRMARLGKCQRYIATLMLTFLISWTVWFDFYVLGLIHLYNTMATIVCDNYFLEMDGKSKGKRL